MSDILPEIIQGDARALPLPDESVDLIVTSPPYWSLRDYGTSGQIGAERTVGEYLDNLIDCTREWVRVLKPSGSMFVNLGDRYGPNKTLLDLPWRYSIRCVDELGLIKRAEIIWAKPNGLPESVVDRVRRSHEVFLHLTKSPRYFAAVDEIREPHSATTHGWKSQQLSPRHGASSGGQDGLRTTERNPLGKLPGSVWSIPTQPLRVPAELGVDHFAAFPMEWPRRLILGWSPREVCTVCGEGRRPVTVKGEPIPHQASHANGYRMPRSSPDSKHGTGAGSSLGFARQYEITGYACACPDTSAPTTPGVVLDPFSGTGTTALVAAMNGRQGIGVDLSADYCDKVARWRVNDPKEQEKATKVRWRPEPEPVVSPDLPSDIEYHRVLHLLATAQTLDDVNAVIAAVPPVHWLAVYEGPTMAALERLRTVPTSESGSVSA